jgi:hypothetical protein
VPVLPDPRGRRHQQQAAALQLGSEFFGLLPGPLWREDQPVSDDVGDGRGCGGDLATQGGGQVEHAVSRQREQRRTAH